MEKDAARVQSIFARFDANGDGFIRRDELANLFLALDCESWSESSLDELFKAADKNNDECVSYKEFCNWLFLPGKLQTDFCKTTDMSGSAISELHEQLDKICKALQDEVSDLVSFDSLPTLLAMIETCKEIQQCAGSAQAKVDVKGISGDSVTVKVSTTTTALSLKKNISDTMGIPISKLSLISTGDTPNVVPSTQAIARIVPQPAGIDFIVREPLSFIPNLKLCMFSQDSTDPLVDIASGRAWRIDGGVWNAELGVVVPETLQVCDVLDRRGVKFTERILFLAEGREVIPPKRFISDAITISLWMLSPFKPRQASHPGDIPSAPLLFRCSYGYSYIAVGDQWYDFDLTTMSPGWHHVCEVWDFPDIEHYVDGNFVGSMPVDPDEWGWGGEDKSWIMPQEILMPGDHRNGPGEVVISDLCFFACAANDEQIEMLAHTT